MTHFLANITLDVWPKIRQLIARFFFQSDSLWSYWGFCTQFGCRLFTVLMPVWHNIPLPIWDEGLLKSAIEDDSPKVSSVLIRFQKVVFYFIPFTCFKTQGDIGAPRPTSHRKVYLAKMKWLNQKLRVW